MKREEINFVLSKEKFIKGGTKEASLKVRDYLTKKETCITNEEFVETVKILVSFASQQEDTIPERWHCDSGCTRSFQLFCLGECSLDKQSSKPCPFFIDSGLK